MRPAIETEAHTKPGFWFACVDIDVLRDPSLSPCDKAVYGVICSHADVRTRISTLAVATIAKEASCGERTTQNCIKKLIERGILEREARFVNGRQVSNLYRVVGHDAICYKEKWNDYSQNIHPENANLPKSAVSCAPEGATCCTPEGAATAHKLEPQDNENQKNNPFPPTPPKGGEGAGEGRRTPRR